MIRVMPANDPVQGLEHRLKLDRSVHDGECTFPQCGAEAPRRSALGGLASPNDHRGWRLLETAEQLQDTLSGWLGLPLVKGDPEVHDGDVDRARSKQIRRLVGGVHPEAVDALGLEKPGKLLGEILLLPDPP